MTGQGSSPHPASLFERRLWYACAGAAGRSVVGRGGAGRGPGARRRPRRRLGAPHGRGEPLSGSRRFAAVGRWEGGRVVGWFDFAAEAVPSCEQQNGTVFSNMSRRPHSNSSPPTAIGRAGREALPPRRGRRRHLRPHRHWFERQALGRAGTETWESVLVSGSHKRAGSGRFYMRVFF